MLSADGCMFHVWQPQLLPRLVAPPAKFGNFTIYVWRSHLARMKPRHTTAKALFHTKFHLKTLAAPNGTRAHISNIGCTPPEGGVGVGGGVWYKMVAVQT